MKYASQMMLKAALVALMTLSFAMTAYADEPVKSTAKSKGEGSSNNAATVSARNVALKSCKEKNQQAQCRAEGHKAGSKAMTACKKSRRNNKKYTLMSENIYKKCHKAKSKLLIVCNLKLRCWYKKK